MTRQFDIAIVGGGVIGLSLARALTSSGAAIALFDAGAIIPPATSAAAGMLAPSFESSDAGPALGEPLYHFGARALSLWPDYAAALEAETGVNVDFRGDGTLGLAFSDDEVKSLSEQAAQVTARGGDAVLIDGGEARKMEPALSPDTAAALWAPQDAQVDPRRLLIALRAAVKKKVVQHIPEKVARIDVGPEGVSCTTQSGATFVADKVVLAGGAVSGLASSEIVFPVKGDALAVEIEDGALTRVIRGPGAYLCPKAGGRVVIGASEARGRTDRDVDDAVIAALKESAAQAVPMLADAGELERWTGLRPGTPDGAPILGEAGERVYLALGHYRNGVLHAPAAAADLAALIVDGARHADLESFNPSRFSAPVTAAAHHG
ncbi:glycine oxidase ThiO [Hyphococcus sp.]|uniref:glycine oxidase ThiO n=1 Tax=Hyphococcus sp. TaxID=2038636 RepID=UPI003CCC04BD